MFDKDNIMHGKSDCVVLANTGVNRDRCCIPPIVKLLLYKVLMSLLAHWEAFHHNVWHSVFPCTAGHHGGLGGKYDTSSFLKATRIKGIWIYIFTTSFFLAGRPVEWERYEKWDRRRKWGQMYLWCLFARVYFSLWWSGGGRAVDGGDIAQTATGNGKGILPYHVQQM